MRCASRPARGEATRPGQRASRSSSSAHPTSARILATTSMASATGGLTSAVVRTFDRLGRSETNTGRDGTQTVRRGDKLGVTGSSPVPPIGKAWNQALFVVSLEDALDAVLIGDSLPPDDPAWLHGIPTEWC